jgi:L-seryl-tRNA(Ser) seleniumtransferase
MMDLDEHFDLWDPPREFVEKSRLPGIPRHGIGRMLKVSQEQIISFLMALDEFCQPETMRQRRAWQMECIQRLQAGLANNRGALTICDEAIPRLEITVDEQALGRTAWDVCRSLRSGDPPIHVGQARLSEGRIVLDPSCLVDEQIPIITERLTFELSD